MALARSQHAQPLPAPAACSGRDCRTLHDLQSPIQSNLTRVRNSESSTCVLSATSIAFLVKSFLGPLLYAAPETENDEAVETHAVDGRHHIQDRKGATHACTFLDLPDELLVRVMYHLLPGGGVVHVTNGPTGSMASTIGQLSRKSTASIAETQSPCHCDSTLPL